MKRIKIAALIVSTLFVLGLTVPIMTSTSGALNTGILLATYNFGTQNTPIQSKQNPVNMTVLFHSDLHSELLPWPLADYNSTGTNDDPTKGGMARIATIITQLRASDPPPILVFNDGDFLMGTPWEWTGPNYASAELNLFSPLGLYYTAVCLGNHEFDYSDHGLSLILNNTNSTLGLANMPSILCSNLDMTDDYYNLGVFIKPNATITAGGVTIGLFSVIGYGANATMFFKGHYNILDPVTTAQQQVNFLKANVPDLDLIIMLSHSGWEEDVALASQVVGIDLILGGHDHELTPDPIVVGNTTIVDAGALGEYLGTLEITVDASNKPGQGITVRSWTPTAINDSTPEDPVADAILANYAPVVNGFLSTFGLPPYSTVIANTTGVPGAGYIAGGESPIGDLIADAIRWQANNVSGSDDYVDFAIVPSGVIRHGFEAASGNITLYDAISVEPLGGPPYEGPYVGWLLTSFYLYGSEIKKAMEFSVYAGGDFFLQVSGLRLKYTPLGAPGSQIVSIEQDFQNGTCAPINDTKLYRVCVNLEGALLIPQIGAMYPMFQMVMKNSTGDPLPLDPEEYVPLILIPPGIPEWLGLVNYLLSDQLGQVDPNYNTTQDRITIWEINPADIFTLSLIGQLGVNSSTASNLMLGGIAAFIFIIFVAAVAVLARRP